MPCGRVSTRSYPRAAHTKASAIPVLPLVASTIVVRPGSIRPSASAASIIATPMRSLTDPPGLSISSLANSDPGASGASRVNWTIGVRPTQSAMLIGIGAIHPTGYLASLMDDLRLVRGELMAVGDGRGQDDEGDAEREQHAAEVAMHWRRPSLVAW